MKFEYRLIPMFEKIIPIQGRGIKKMINKVSEEDLEYTVLSAIICFKILSTIEICNN